MILIGITTIPKRVHLLAQTIESLIQQSIRADVIFVNMPRHTKSGQAYPARFAYAHSTVQVNRCDDKGPITKLYPLLSVSQPNDTIILADDDHIYNPYTLEALLGGIQTHHAVGFSGRKYKRGSLQFIQEVTQPTPVNMLETFSAVAYKRHALAGPEVIDTIHRQCPESFFCDDIVIANVLNVVPYVIPLNKNSWHYNPAAGSTPQLHHANFGSRNRRVYQCVNTYRHLSC